MPFQAHVELLEIFLDRRAEAVERIQALLNAQRKPAQFLRDRRLLARHFEDCFYTLRGLTPEQARLRGRLEEAHWARGFRPREIPGMHNDLVDPAEMMRRVFHLWQQTRWPGRSGRDHYAQTLFNVYLIRQLALLGMRAWDARASEERFAGIAASGKGDGAASRSGAGERLARIQRLLDRLWESTPPGQPVFVRDARWLIPVAQSPATDDLAPYFEVADEIAEAFGDDDRLEIQKAVVRMAGGHLRSYLHYYITQNGLPLDDSRLVRITRKANALDYSLLIRGLVPLLEAYERSVKSGDAVQRLELADAICQGISPDPELFINRVSLLGAYSMVEHLFVSTAGAGNEARAVYTPMGERHVAALEEYAARIARAAQRLYEDCARLEPVDGGYSPFGAIYGFSSNLLEHMALKSVERDAVTRFSLEDVFRAGGADKLDWVNGWRKLPHVDPQVAKLYAYPHEFAAQIYARVERALREGAAAVETGARDARRTGRLFVVLGDDSTAAPTVAAVPDLPIRYIQSSDRDVVAAQRAEACDQAQLSKERVEGFYVVSYETPGGWVAITKDFLTEVLGAGLDAKLSRLPGLPVDRLRLTGRDLVSIT